MRFRELLVETTVITADAMLPIHNCTLTSQATQMQSLGASRRTNLCTLTAFMMDDEYDEEEEVDSGEYPDLMTPS